MKVPFAIWNCNRINVEAKARLFPKKKRIKRNLPQLESLKVVLVLK